MRIFSLILVITLAFTACSKKVVKVEEGAKVSPTPAAEVIEEGITELVEEPPEYPGGDRARQKFIRKKLKYPKHAVEHKIEGTLVVVFVVEKDGSVSNVTIKNKLGYGLDEEAKRVVSLMKWRPGKVNGKPVRVRVFMPINFRL